MQPGVGLVVEVFGQVFRRRVQDFERLEIVDHLVVEPVDYRLHDLAQVLEIEQQPGPVEFAPSQRDAHAIVMTVRVFALSFVVAQVMSCGERIFNRDFEHVSL